MSHGLIFISDLRKENLSHITGNAQVLKDISAMSENAAFVSKREAVVEESRIFSSSKRSFTGNFRVFE